MTAPERDPVAEAAQGVQPDYSRLGFRQLQQLAKKRGLPGDGSTIDLVNKLKAYDVQHNLEVDTTLPDDDDDEPEVDLLADDEPDDRPSASTASPATDKPSDHTSDAAPPAPSPAGDGEVASASSPAGLNLHVPPRQTETTGGTPVAVAAPQGLPVASDTRGRANLDAKEGPVGTGEGHGGATARAFRQEFPLGNYEITDDMHFRFIADTHGYAQRAGFETKGGLTTGERIGFSTDADGHRTVIYQVPLRRTR